MDIKNVKSRNLDVKQKLNVKKLKLLNINGLIKENVQKKIIFVNNQVLNHKEKDVVHGK